MKRSFLFPFGDLTSIRHNGLFDALVRVEVLSELGQRQHAGVEVSQARVCGVDFVVIAEQVGHFDELKEGKVVHGDIVALEEVLGTEV